MMADDEKIAVAVTFLDEKATRWCTLALPRPGRPRSWTESEVSLTEHYSPSVERMSCTGSDK